MQPSITPSPSARAACAIRTRLADAAGLRELDVDPVRDRGARGDVGRACGSPRRRRSGSASASSASAPPGSPAGSGCSQYSTPSSASCGSASSASSSDQHSLTSTWSGTSVTARTARTRSTSSPSPPPSFSFSRRNRPLACRSRLAAPSRRGRRARSSTTSAARARSQPEQPPDRLAGELPAEVVQRGVDRRPGRELLAPAAAASISSSANGSSPRSPATRLDVGERRLRRLVVALDRRRLAEARDAVVADLDLDHVGRRPASPRAIVKRLGQLEGDDPGAQLHAGTLDASHAPVAQGIERAPPEREVAGSIPARRIARRHRDGDSTVSAGAASPTSQPRPAACRAPSRCSRRAGSRTRSGTGSSTRSCSSTSTTSAGRARHRRPRLAANGLVSLVGARRARHRPDRRRGRLAALVFLAVGYGGLRVRHGCRRRSRRASSPGSERRFWPAASRR